MDKLYKDKNGKIYSVNPIQEAKSGWVELTSQEVEDLLKDEALTPSKITRSQGKAALINRGLWSAVLSYVASIEDETERLLAEVALHDTTHWHIDSKFLCGVADVIGLSDDDKKQLFKEASEINL